MKTHNINLMNMTVSYAAHRLSDGVMLFYKPPSGIVGFHYESPSIFFTAHPGHINLILHIAYVFFPADSSTVKRNQKQKTGTIIFIRANQRY